MGGLRNIAVTMCVLLLLCRSSSQASAAEGAEDAFLSTPVNPSFLADVPLTTALSRFGYSVKRCGYLVFGTEVLLNQAGEEPHVTLNLLDGDTVQTAMDSVLSQLPDYKWAVISDHLVNVFPIQQTRNDLLGIRVARFDVKEEYPANILAVPTAFIPQLMGAIVSENCLPFGGCGYGASWGLNVGPPMSFSFKDLTIRDILNEVAAGMIKTFPADHPPVGWVYALKQDRTVRAGRTHSWKSQASVPLLNWKSAVAARLHSETVRGKVECD